MFSQPGLCFAAGRMVYTSSIFSFFTCLNMGAYSVSKRGLEAFADCLRVEMASFGVKVRAGDPVQVLVQQMASGHEQHMMRC